MEGTGAIIQGGSTQSSVSQVPAPAPERTGGPTPAQDASWSPVNLLLDFERVAELLRWRLAGCQSQEDVFDAFLLAAALHQIAEDHLHRDLCSLRRVAEHLPALVGARRARVAVGVARAGYWVGVLLRTRRRSERLLRAWGEQHAALVQRLADAVVSRATTLDATPTTLAADSALPPELRQTVGRLPHCFRSFDQRPEDFARLAGEFAARYPNRATPLLVVGLRTAGSYLAPLLAGFLGAGGYRDVQTLTLRPDQQLLSHERARVRRACEREATLLLVDEPPRSGSQFVRAARELERLGVPHHSLVLLVPLFANRVPATMSGYTTVPLRWDAWTIHERLTPDAVKADLEALLPAVRIDQIERVHTPSLDASPRRGHITSVFRVALTDADSGECHEEQIAAEGVGFGYLGRHAAHVANQLAEFVPELRGLRDGLLYRAWLPEEWRGAGNEDAILGGRIASYVLARHRALPAEDMTRRMAGRDTAPDLIGRMLGEAFGRAALVVRPLVQRAAQRLLTTARPSVIDGSMTPAHWFAPPGEVANARKVDFHARAFSNEDCACYDPVYDLACAAAGGHTTELGEAVANAYEQLSGTPIAPERWLLYQLVHHRYIEQPRARAEGDVGRWLDSERSMARAHQLYFQTQFFSDLPVPSSGPLCALDVDWVLEVRWLGFPALSPASAAALRSLNCHGYRPVIVTGRSLEEVKERCRRYCLAGGVAEYGAVVYDHSSGGSRALLKSADQAALAELRAALGAVPHVHVDPLHEYSIRAYHLVDGDRRGLDPEAVESVLAQVGGGSHLLVIPARSQTDFIIAHIDKGTGLRALAQELGGQRIVLAAGDSIHDLPMLRLAERAALPANADAELARLLAPGPPRVERSKHCFGAGVSEAVSKLIGHQPGRCPVCATNVTERAESRLLLTALEALDGAGFDKAWQAAALWRRLARVSWHEQR